MTRYDMVPLLCLAAAACSDSSSSAARAAVPAPGDETTRQGCTPAYWRQAQHFGSWPVDLDVTMAEAFPSSCGTVSAPARADAAGRICPLGLLEALEPGGDHVDALARSASGAWLNAGSVGFAYSPSEVRRMVDNALAGGDVEATSRSLAAANEAGCPLGEVRLYD